MTIEPVIIERTCGGFLAVTPAGANIGFAVEAVTETAAREAFAEAEVRWLASARRAGVEFRCGDPLPV